jgi:taurine dioxygenase
MDAAGQKAEPQVRAVGSAAGLRIVPSGDAIGAEILGADLSRPLDAASFDLIEGALHQYGVVVLRGQSIDVPQQKAFSLLWGDELDVHPVRQFAMPGHPEILILSNIVKENGEPAGAADAAQYWHTDLQYMSHPSRVSILYGVEIPHDDAGRPLGETEFSSTAAAYDALPGRLRKRLEGLRAAHLAQKPKSRTHFTKALDAETLSRLKETEHPLVRTHPYTGRKCIYVSPGFTTRIVGLPASESDALLQELFDFILQPRFMYIHRWAKGDVLVWDNCSTVHQGVGNYRLPQRRLMYRTIVKGTEPF